VLLTARQHRNAEREFLPAKVLSPNNTNKADPTTRADGCERSFQIESQGICCTRWRKMVLPFTIMLKVDGSGQIIVFFPGLIQMPLLQIKICRICRAAAHDDDEDCPQDFGLDATLEAAEREGWRRCYRCRAMVELTVGCRHITCKCKAEFWCVLLLIGV